VYSLEALALKSPWAQTGCPVCGSHDFFCFFHLENYPVSVGILYETQAEALKSPCGDINLNFCNTCSYIGNWSYRPELLRFDQRYDVTLHHSPVYQQFITSLVDRLINTYGIKHKNIIDIGCGNGKFLQEICERGGNCGIGIDPSAPWEIHGHCAGDIKLIQDFYSERYADLEADLVCCRHILELVADPKDLLGKIRQGVAQSPHTVTYLEVPHGAHTFKEGVIWNISYPNSGYFYPEALSTLAQQTAFEVLSLGPCFTDDQYLGIDLKPGALGARPLSTLPQVEAHRQDIELFSQSYQDTFSFWQAKLRHLEATGRKVSAWCAGTRAISFFSFLGIRDAIPVVVDINPGRQGKFLPVTGQKVVAPEFLKEFQPEVIIVTNKTFLQEIQEQVAGLGLESEFLLL
jgi:SAM-dependent methyltransferase